MWTVQLLEAIYKVSYRWWRQIRMLAVEADNLKKKQAGWLPTTHSEQTQPYQDQYFSVVYTALHKYCM